MVAELALTFYVSKDGDMRYAYSEALGIWWASSMLELPVLALLLVDSAFSSTHRKRGFSPDFGWLV